MRKMLTLLVLHIVANITAYHFVEITTLLLVDNNHLSLIITLNVLNINLMSYQNEAFSTYSR